MSDHPEIISSAIAYANAGIPVFPCLLRGAGGKKAKSPYTTNGFKDASCSVEQIKCWWANYPDATIGMPTGKVSGLVVMDIDPRNGGDYALQNLVDEYGALSDTLSCITGSGGTHYYFRYPGREVRSSASKIASGIDIKGDRGYVILPPSGHESGNHYFWDGEFDLAAVADLPPWLLELIVAEKPTSNSNTSDGNPIPEGQRNSTLASLAGTMRQRGMTEPEIQAAILAVNCLRCQPPLSENEVNNIARSVCRYEPDSSWVATTENHYEQMFGAPLDNSPAPVITMLDTVESRDIRWLWQDRFALGKLSIIAGDPGVGKSTLTLNIAATVSTGQPWPLELQHNSPGGVILLSAEDDKADTIKPRLEAIGADCSRIGVLEAIRCGTTERSFDLTQDVARLAEAINRVPDCKLVIIDPISAYMGKIDSHNNTDVRGALKPLCDMAADKEVAVILVTHLNKGGGINPLYRATGSLAFVAAARTVFLVTAEDERRERILFLPAKNNIGPDWGTGFAYRLDHGKIEWLEALTQNAAQFTKKQFEITQSRPTPAQDEAVDFLVDTLKEGPVWSKDIKQLAREMGLNINTLHSARKQCGVLIRREGFGCPTFWHLSEHHNRVPATPEDRDKCDD